MRQFIFLLFIIFSAYTVFAQSITADSVMAKVAKGKPYTLVLLKAGAEKPKDEQLMNKMQMDHLIHLFQLEKDDRISIFGPVTDDNNLRGIIIFNTTDQAAIKKDLESDPYIKGGYLKYEIFNWFTIPGQKIPQ